MQNIGLSDQLYQQASQRAAAAGFPSVDEYVAEIIESEMADTQDFDHLFTPQVIAGLDVVRAEIQAGARTYSMEEVEQHFREKSEAWRAKHSN